MVLTSLGISSSFLLWIAAPVVNPAHAAIYHWSGPPSHLFVPVLVDLLGFATVVSLLLFSASRPNRWRAGVWGALILFTPSIELKNLAIIDQVVPWHWLTVSLPIAAILCWLVMILCWRTSFAWRLEPAIAAAQTLFFFLGVGGVCLLAEIGWSAWHADGLNQRSSFTQLTLQPGVSVRKPRVIWIVFDELSFQQVYGHRLAGLRLPAFDTVAAEATNFTNTIPAGYHTEDVLPALLSGRNIDEMRSTAAGQLLVKTSTEKRYKPFDATDTVFTDARQLGYKVAVAGWYNPYCRILSKVLDSCYWTYDERIGNGMYPDNSLVSNALQPFVYEAAQGFPHRVLAHFLPVRTIPVLAGRQHIEDFRRLSAAAIEALRNPAAEFVLLHLPAPHPGGIYNREAGEFSEANGSYIDNLALADRCLGEMRQLLQDSEQWSGSTVVVMGDHSWRTAMWRGAPDWTPEDERASQEAGFDPRPVYLVKLSGQRTGSTVDTPFHALNTRGLLDRLLSHQIGTPGDLASWASQVH